MNCPGCGNLHIPGDPSVCQGCARIEAEKEERRTQHQPKPGDLGFTPTNNHERALHRRALRDKNYGNGGY